MADESDKDKKKKVKGFKEFDPGNYIDIEPTINEAKVGEVVVSWGRMNPITTGHEKLINRVLNVAKSKNATPAVFLTHSQDKTKNPLSYNDKIKYAEVAFGKIIKRSTAKTIIQLMQQLQKKFKKVTLVVGSDRYKEMDTLLNKYNGKEYKFDEIEVVSAGARDPDADGVKGMSASKMREYAVSDNIKKFTTGLPSKLKTSAADIMASIKKGMGMSEEYEEDFIEEDELDEALTRQQRIKRGRQMRRMRVKMKRGREKASRRRANIDVLKRRSRKAARNVIKTRLAGNKRYADMEPAEKERIDKRIEKISKQRIDNLAIKLLPSVKKKERERLQARHKKNESVDLNEMWGAYVTKRPHMLMDKNNKPKFDKRFKMFKPKQVTEMNEFDIEDIVELMESVEKFTETAGKYYTGVAKNKKEEVEMDEAHDPKHVKMAVGIASDKRYAGGNMTGAVKQIDKIKKGLSNHPQVRAVLKRQNEELINKLDEAIMSNQLDELTAAEKKLVNQMYDKKGNLTPLGKKVMNHGKKKGDKGFVESLDDRFEAFMAESIDEVLDTPKAMDSYRNKAKYSKDKAGNSAMATVLRGDGDGKKDLKTMSKRTKGLKMADRNATKKTFKALRAGYSEDLDEDAKMKKQSDDNLKSLHKQFKGQDQKMPSTQHMMKRITKEMKRRNMSESEEVEINETTVSATKKPVNITGPDGKTRTVMKSTRSKQTDDRGQDKIKTNEEETLATNANKELQDREKKEKIVKRSKREMKKKDDAEIESKARRDGGPADVSEEGGAGDQGTDKLVNKYKKDTPNC